MFARLTDIRRHVGVTIKADVPDSMTVPTWIPIFAGANWHERETHEMFGIGFDGHPDLRNLYLPGEFEGFPLRKDFPLLARMVKPWPGIVDVEPMPAEDEDVPPTADTAAGDAVEAATETSTDDAAPSTTDESADATVVDTPPTDDAAPSDETTTGSDAESAAVGDAVAAADAAPDAVEPEPALDDAATDSDASDLSVAEPAPADATETDRAELAEDAEAAGVGVESDTAVDGTVPADLGPGTTTESTDADAEAPTPGPPTEAHPDGLTPGDAADESGDDS